jgi:hypothetical protein
MFNVFYTNTTLETNILKLALKHTVTSNICNFHEGISIRMNHISEIKWKFILLVKTFDTSV